MKKRFYFLVPFLLGLMLLATRSHAVPVPGLYDAVVPVADTSETERGPAFARALEKVLVRAAGTEDVLQRSGINDVLANAGNLVQAYRYQRAGEDGLELAVSFGAVGVTRALSSIDAPVWGANRPAVLAWVAAQSRTGRTLATADEPAAEDPESLEWGTVMQEAARSRGVPVVLPEYDEQDRATVGLSDIWGLFMAPIEQASESYRSDLLGVARISEEGEGYTARWALKGTGLSLDGQVRGDSRQGVADAVVGAWAEALAERYAVKPGSEQTLQRVDVLISAVNDLQAYAEIRQSLAAMEPISGAAPVRIFGDKLRIRVAFNGELELLREHLALERRLVPVQAQSLAGPSNAARAQQVIAESDKAAGDQGPAEAAPENAELDFVDPAIQPIPMPGEGLSVEMEAAIADGGEEDFSSLYPVLHFRWAGAPEQERFRTSSPEAR